jgi:hypothetical protein
MDPLGAFKNEVFRPIASIVLPGMLAITPFAVVLGNSTPEVMLLYQKQPLIFFFLLSSAATVVGMLLESIGSSIERGIDTCMEREYLAGSDAVWAAYLGCACSDSYARRYLGTLVTRLKFINSMIPAVVLFATGMVALNAQIDRWSDGLIFCWLMVLLGLVCWLFKSSVELSEAALFSRLKMLPAGHGIELDISAHTVSRWRHFVYATIELRTARIEQMNFKTLRGWALAWETARLFLGRGPTKRRQESEGLELEQASVEREV